VKMKTIKFFSQVSRLQTLMRNRNATKNKNDDNFDLIQKRCVMYMY
jgi:hypothetical protein